MHRRGARRGSTRQQVLGPHTHIWNRVRALKAAAEGWERKGAASVQRCGYCPACENAPLLEGSTVAHMAWACSGTGSEGTVCPQYSHLPHFLREVGPSVQTTAKIPGDLAPTKCALSIADRGACVCSTASPCSYCSCCT